MKVGKAICAAGIASFLLILPFCPADCAGPDIDVQKGSRVRLIPGSVGVITSSFQDKPDLTVADTWTVPGTFCRYAVVDIHSSIGNIGTVAAVDSFYFDMWFDGDNIGFARIDGLGAGETVELVLENYAWPGDTLSHVVTCMADTDHEIDEEMETNNIHLEYFSAELCTTCTFLTLPFQSGWNWFSLNVDDPDMSLDHVLASLGTNGIYIKSQTAFAEYVPAWSSWFGTLASLTCHDTYMIKMAQVDTLDFCGFPYDVSTEFSLPAGWSWVSYLPQRTMGINDALGSLEASGEYIKNQTAFAEYVTEWSSWFGTLVDMCPGEGYKIRMGVADTLVYPDSAEVTGSRWTNRPREAALARAADEWTVDTHGFEANLCLTAEVHMGERPCVGPGDRLGAFCGGECRGVASPLLSPEGKHIFYMTVHGSGSGGEVLSLRYRESGSGRVYEVREGFDFRPDVVLGSSLHPMVFHVSSRPESEDGDSARSLSLENHPDPFSRSTTFAFRLAGPVVVDLAVYNVCGEKVADLCDGYLESGTHNFVWDGRTGSGRRAPGGIYFCRLVCGDQVITEKMVLMK
jgi:hypothetical protein